jgi:hypothetical protein
VIAFPPTARCDGRAHQVTAPACARAQCNCNATLTVSLEMGHAHQGGCTRQITRASASTNRQRAALHSANVSCSKTLRIGPSTCAPAPAATCSASLHVWKWLATKSLPARCHVATTSRYHLGTISVPSHYHLGTISLPPRSRYHLSTISVPPRYHLARYLRIQSVVWLGDGCNVETDVLGTQHVPISGEVSCRSSTITFRRRGPVEREKAIGRVACSQRVYRYCGA